MNSRFQSLAGFLARCDSWERDRLFLRRAVSIPGGFSGSLRPVIPSRSSPASWWFQSLAGFLARCDGIPGAMTETEAAVSIPGGFSGSLRLKCWMLREFMQCQFQSLAGFLARCDNPEKSSSPPSPLSFNPWRVFWLVATTGLVDGQTC